MYFWIVLYGGHRQLYHGNWTLLPDLSQPSLTFLFVGINGLSILYSFLWYLEGVLFLSIVMMVILNRSNQ